jgi:hypothetical protein
MPERLCMEWTGYKPCPEPCVPGKMLCARHSGACSNCRERRPEPDKLLCARCIARMDRFTAAGGRMP